MSESEDRPSIDEAALAWVVRVHSGDFSRADRQRLAQWLNADSAHARAYREAIRLWDDADHLHQDARTGRIGVAPLDSHSPKTRRRYSVRWPAAGLAVAMLVMVLVLPEHYADISTGTQPETVTLADGSTLNLDARTRINVRIDDGQRSIQLLEGAAWFRVAADRQRPFRVTTDDLTVTALGTEFLVDQTDTPARVTVTEHAVEVRSRLDPERPPLRLPQGQTLTAGRAWQVNAVGQLSQGTWRDGQLIVENQALADVAKDLSRYDTGWVVIADEKLAQQKVSGAFDIRHPRQALDTLALALPLQVRHLSPYLTVISAR